MRGPPPARGAVCHTACPLHTRWPHGASCVLPQLANPALGEEHVAEIEKKTREAIDTNGWLHSGDKGCMDKDGMFKITGRYKELIITAGGENIAPVCSLATPATPRADRSRGPCGP